MFLSFYSQQWVIDLSNAPNNIKKVGFLATDGLDGQISFVMAEKGMLFLAPTSMEYRATFTKKFFNISSPIVKSSVSMDPTSPYGCPSATYYVPPQSISSYSHRNFSLMQLRFPYRVRAIRIPIHQIPSNCEILIMRANPRKI